ncbi:hypothetical protein ACHAWO_005391 [Cyclotella atomus]|uniref:Uncharacterized protein n=1 Tax=Cyclotella atomus TaxID=382360 RepID=A0ABD3N5I5_9STRA
MIKDIIQLPLMKSRPTREEKSPTKSPPRREASKAKACGMNTELKSWLSAATAVLLMELWVSNAFTCHRYHECRQPSLRETLMTLQTASSTAADEPSADFIAETKHDHVSIFLRFSPLIGGPPFLPLHVEVLLTQDVPPSKSNTKDQQMHQLIEGILKNTTNNRYLDIHRFDFLPQNPRDGDTIVRLMLLKGVPGNVRYRNCLMVDRDSLQDCSVADGNEFNLLIDNDDGDIADGVHSANRKGLNEGVTILLRVGSVSSYNKFRSQSIISTATSFVKDYKTTAGKELRIVGGKNCVSFASDLLWYLNEVHGIDIDVSMPQLF